MPSYLAPRITEPNLLEIRRPHDLADALGMSLGQLRYHVERSPYADRYSAFEIPKKRGGARQILAPVGAIRELQERFHHLLIPFYKRSASSHGFVKHRSIISNAAPHVGQRLVLNVDLTQFFDAINRGRVYGLFASLPFQWEGRTAMLAANLCCINNALPQGAPTSPILSNMICKRLDRRLETLAAKTLCVYTRYADDITFSTSRGRFPNGLVEPATTGTGSIKIGTQLREVLETEGFRVNERKVRVAGLHGRQEVTGLVTNERLNVRRSFVRQIRNMLHAWEKYGLADAQAAFVDRSSPPPRSFQRVLRGKLSFLAQVRGHEDALYRGLYTRYAQLDPTARRLPPLVVPHPLGDIVQRTVWVLECEESSRQGSGFVLRGVGLVTCAHVLGPQTRVFLAHQSAVKYEVDVVARSDQMDYATLRFRDWPLPLHALDAGSSSRLRQLDQLYAVGFPNYTDGQTPSIRPCHVSGWRPRFGVDLISVSGGIVRGMSGGPLLDGGGRVVGVNVTGADDEGRADEDPNQGAVPIDAIVRALRST